MGLVTHYLKGDEPERAMKNRTIFYYVNDASAAKELAKAEREKQNNGFTRDASTLQLGDWEECTRVVIMPDVPEHYERIVRATYGGLDGVTIYKQGEQPETKPHNPDADELAGRPPQILRGVSSREVNEDSATVSTGPRSRSGGRGGQ